MLIPNTITRSVNTTVAKAHRNRGWPIAGEARFTLAGTLGVCSQCATLAADEWGGRAGVRFHKHCMNDMETTTTSRNPKSIRVQSPFRPRINRGIHFLIDAAYAARVGAAQMTLDDWRDVEQELKRKFANEQHQT